LKEAYQGRASGRVRSFALYGDTTGETDEYGLPVRLPWANDYRGRAMVVYGHTPMPEVQWVNNTLCVDTGCVFGGKLTALRYPEREIVDVPAEQVWCEPARPLHPAPAATAIRPGDELDINDVLGKRIVETRHHGRVSIREENAAGALEVMSRFAIDPHWLLYLPPTMAPTATAAGEDLLEHPDEAFAAYRSQGVRALVCQEKHMGSRAVVLLCRDEGVARDRFAGREGEVGVVHTRTGRAFFPAEATRRLLTRLGAAVTHVGLWDELGADWLLLDCELMPWSVKADELLREQYAAVAAAAGAALPTAVAALTQAASNGLDVAPLLARTTARQDNAGLFRQAYRRYTGGTDGEAGVHLAPFQLLATGGRAPESGGASYADREHGWHLALADRLVAAAPDLLQITRRHYVDSADARSCADGVAWWEELTAGGGEGMVVKPSANLSHAGRKLVQPGIKVRGREYLRIVYGPDYTEPANLSRLRDRNVAHKRSMALREYALGLEALDRAAAGEPLWRVHEAVFAVLALESESVDPRL
jgi:protein phosphatase